MKGNYVSLLVSADKMQIWVYFFFSTVRTYCIYMDKQNQMILYLRISNIMWEVNDANKHVIKVFAECYISKL